MKIQRNYSAYAIQSDLVLALSCIEQRPSPLLDQAFHQSLIQAEVTIRRASENLQHAMTARSNAAKVRQLQGKGLIKTVRDFYQGLNRAIARSPRAKLWKDVYACQVNMPKHRVLTSEWLEQARQIGAANASAGAIRALADGVPQVTNPSAEDVAATLPDAVAADETWRAAIRTLKQRQQEHRQAQAEGIRLLISLRLRIRTMAQGVSLSARHDLMQAYGIRLSAERQNPEDANGQNTAADPATGTAPARIPA